jgi:hypoxanthine phosphoribosyltransferase
MIVQPQQAIAQIAESITNGLGSYSSDSLVFDSFEEISVVVPGYCESHSHAQGVDRGIMLWPEYWNRIEAICSLLEGPSTNGQFAPDAIIGISNGGQIVADLVGRELFRGKPILGLWANRFTQPPGDINGYWFFDNDYNDALVDVIIKKCQGRSAEILVLDDHLGTGITVRQLVQYLKIRFEQKVDILYIPMFSKRPEYIHVVEDLFPYRFKEGTIFPRVAAAAFLDSLFTKASRFPYRKELSGT